MRAHRRDPRMAINRLPLVANLDHAVVAALTAEAISDSVRPRELVVHQAAPAERVYFVLDGAFVVEKTGPVQYTQVTGFLFAGDFFGVVHDGHYGYSVRALTAGWLFAVDREAFEQLCDHYPALQRAVLQQSSNELAVAQDHLMTLGRKSARERVAGFLLQLYRRGLDRGAVDDSQLWLPMRRSDMADHLGLTLETVSRIMSEMKRNGVIQMQSAKTLTIRDPDRLAALAERV